MKNFTKYLLIMVIPLAVLLSRPVIPLMTLTLGQEVKLSTVPFDPRDIFRGDYVELSFAIEEIGYEMISPGLLSKLREELRNDKSIEVYVSLKPDNSGIYNAAFVSDAPPAGDVVYVRGRAESHIRSERVMIKYGNRLSHFYVRENTGLELEEAARKGEVYSLAKVWKGFIVLDDVVPFVK